jgi:hypothetical protein
MEQKSHANNTEFPTGGWIAYVNKIWCISNDDVTVDVTKWRWFILVRVLDGVQE